jgi:hypothetical protein
MNLRTKDESETICTRFAMQDEHPRTGESLQRERLPEPRADHIPEDVLAEEDAETRVMKPVADPLGHLSGASDDVLTEIDASSRSVEKGQLTPTDDEVMDLTPDEPERS